MTLNGAFMYEGEQGIPEGITIAEYRQQRIPAKPEGFLRKILRIFWI